LVEKGATTLALNPLVAKRTTPLSNAIRDHKTDPIDALGIAMTVQREAAQLGRFTYHSGPARTGLHKLQSVQRVVRKSLTNIKKNWGSLLDLVFPELGSLKLGGATQRELLRTAPTPSAIAKLPFTQLQSIVGKHAENVHQSARDSMAPAALAQACEPAINALLESIEVLEAQLKSMDRRIARLAAQAVDSDWLLLARTLPAFGAKTTPIVLSYLPRELIERDQPRKAKVARIQALFGMDPRVRTSGQWKGKTKLSKRGIRPARVAMYQISMCSLIHDPQALAYYRHLRNDRHQSHKVALFNLARKHLRRLVAVLESGQPYQVQSPPTS
jgi:transposase